MKIPKNRRAFALVLVLIALVISSSMAVFFLTSVARERLGVNLYATGAEVHHLAGMPVSEVIGLINAATKEGVDPATGIRANPVSWASQPGLIRTFDSTGNPSNIYKLYSWDNYVESGLAFNPFATVELPPVDWRTETAHYVDINQPVNDVYPIIDPRAEGEVAGFSVNEGNPVVGGSNRENAPMPVKWLYVLEDGQVVAPSGGSGNLATIPGATVSNPIIGRIAFWTDDETCKVNINTASEGAFWDWPKAASSDELQFAVNPPVAGEYNRLGGHPAMTALSAVFTGLDPGYRWDNVGTYQTKMRSILEIAPRVKWDDLSSRGGTYPIQKYNANYDPKGSDFGTGSSISAPTAPISPDTDRLFATADEILFTPLRAQVPSIPLEELRRAGFFLTSSSRAPETTLFETPRISLWPVTWPFQSAHYKANPGRQDAAYVAKTPADPVEQNTWMRAEEKLLAFVSTLNKLGAANRYYFQRQNPDSPTADAAISRNREILDYLLRMSSMNIPGYGGNFQDKYPRESGAPAKTMEFVLANVFNMTRSMVNQYTLQTTGRMLYSYTPVSFHSYSGTTGYVEKGAFNAIPLRMDLGSGTVTTLSEFPRLTEAAMVFFATDRVKPSLKGGVDPTDLKKTSNPYNWDNLINVDPTQSGINPANTKQPNTYPSGSRTTEMRVALILDFSQITGSTHNNNPIFWVKIIAGSAPSVGGVKVLKSGATQFNYTDNGSFDTMPSYMRPMVERDSTGKALQAKTFNNGITGVNNYAFISDPIPTDPNGVNFSLSGGSITVELYALKDGDPNIDPTTDSTLLIDRYNVDLSSWAGSHPTPLMPYWQWYDRANTCTTTYDPNFPNRCPNPRYDDFDASFGPTKWAATEIPLIYSGAAQDFAAVKNTPGRTNNWNAWYAPKTGTSGDGSIVYPVSPHFSDTNPIFYVARATVKGVAHAPVMSNFPMRVNFWMGAMQSASGNRCDGNYSINDFISENSGNKIAYNRSGMFEGGGFPVTNTMDTILSVVADPSRPGNGDTRLASQFNFKRVDDVCGSGAFIRMPQTYLDAPRLNYQWHTLGRSSGTPSHTGIHYHLAYSLLAKSFLPSSPTKVMGAYNGLEVPPFNSLGTGCLTSGTFPVSNIGSNSSVGDWSSAPGAQPDGSNIPRLDQDFQSLSTESGTGTGYKYVIPYFRVINSQADGLGANNAKGYFSPNRQVMSPISILGNLPSSMTVGWQTLLFNPKPSPHFLNGTNHPGAANPPDHLMLDWFWMPVAEPYPISEQFSTAGKINLNYQIFPFTYIERKTGLHALMKSTWLTAINPRMTEDYKSYYQITLNQSGSDKTRFRIDVGETLKQMDDEVFAAGKILRSASEVCSLTLVPADQGLTYQTARSNFWPSKMLTSDTAREQPYDQLYSRVTTKSNTFTVHWRVQSLRKSQGSNAAQWDESRDRRVSELRGSTLIERYLDPNATDLPDYATTASPKPLSVFYKWRVVAENYFQP